MVSDPSKVDAAIRATLLNDPQLAALMPGGVHFDVPSSGKTQFVVISLMFHEDTYVFGGRGFERSLYLVKAVDKNTDGADANAAAARIDALLQDQPLTITGYVHSLTARTERMRDTEVDGEDADARWQHRGAQYEVVVAPVAVGAVA